MTGLCGIDKYIEMDLIKVTDEGKTIYYAVVPDTADNMLSVDYGMFNDPKLRQIKMERLGQIHVQRLKGDNDE